ncbi:MAG: hypothetical protein JSR47_05880 [Proteobacteria bacterium]|nr:hypothetical protein [Pseudomonadota bacterium]
MTAKHVRKEEQADLEAKVSNARADAKSAKPGTREEADLKILEQEALGKKLQAKHEKASAGGDDKLDKALKDTFPSSDPVSMVQAAPKKAKP